MHDRRAQCKPAGGNKSETRPQPRFAWPRHSTGRAPARGTLHFGIRHVSVDGSLQGGLQMRIAQTFSALMTAGLAAGVLCMSSMAQAADQAADPLPHAK